MLGPMAYKPGTHYRAPSTYQQAHTHLVPRATILRPRRLPPPIREVQDLNSLADRLAAAIVVGGRGHGGVASQLLHRGGTGPRSTPPGGTRSMSARAHGHG